MTKRKYEFMNELQSFGKLAVEFTGSLWWLMDGIVVQAPLTDDGKVDLDNTAECENCSPEMLAALKAFLIAAEEDLPNW